MSKQIAKDSSIDECVEVSCKSKPKALHFCDKHYKEFKFGAIRKDGTRPLDYEKKLSEYEKNKNAYK